jgi:hypothetical protein
LARKKNVYPVAQPHDDDIRVWLGKNGYPDFLAQVDALIAKWHSQGLKTRRNWWDIYAGDLKGNPRTVDGIEFPVLRAARRRKNLPDVPHAVFRSEDEPIPPIRKGPRWQKKPRKKR